MNILRTYPQPDSPAPHLRSRERAMAVFKYLLNMEPGAAVKHERFAVIEHAFEQSERRGWNACNRAYDVGEPPDKSLEPSLCEELSQRIELGEVTIDTSPRPIPPTDFQPDGL